jgi:phospholipase/carboxylesterase
MADENNWHKEDGFEFALYPAKTEKPESLVIILHGFGGNARGWQRAAQDMQNDIPGADVIALQAPLKLVHPDLPPDQDGYMWFPYNGGTFLSQTKLWLTHIFNHLPIIDEINAFADAQLKKRGLAPQNLAYVGQSMGAIVALQTGLGRKDAVAGIVSHAGAVLPLTKVRSRPPVLLVMGEKDEIFNGPSITTPGLKGAFYRAVSFAHRDSMRRLEDKGVPHSEQIIAGMGHAITAQAWKAGTDFLKGLPGFAKKNSPS